MGCTNKDGGAHMLSVKKNQFSKVVVFSIVIMNIWFARETLSVFREVGAEPVTLIMSWFAFTGGELWMLSSIKKRKIKKDGNEND